MSIRKQIDIMKRDSLVNLGIKLELKGHTNFFVKPYINKENLKELILNKIKDYKKLKRSNSQNNNNIRNKNPGNLGNLCDYNNPGHKTLTRSRSLPSLKRRSLKKNYIPSHQLKN